MLHANRNGFVEYYMAISLLAIMSAATAVIAQQQIKKIQLEKNSWQIQEDVWRQTSQDNDFEGLDLKRKQQGYEIDKQFKQKSIEVKANNIVHAVYDLQDVLFDYVQCGDFREPVTFLAMKKGIYRHKFESIRLDFSKNNVGHLNWIKHFWGSNTPKDFFQSDYQHINKAFTGDGSFLDFVNPNKEVSTGWTNRQLLWQEAIFRYDKKKVIVPLQFMGTVKLIQVAGNIATLKAPILSVKKQVFKKAFKKVAKKVLMHESIKEFEDATKSIPKKVKRPIYRHEKCQELQQI